MANENYSLSESILRMEKCLDNLLTEQRRAAHNAIDMDDWDKAQEILAVAKKSISSVETWKTQFAALKNDILKSNFFSENSTETISAEAVPAESVSAPESESAENVSRVSQPEAAKPEEPAATRPDAESVPTDEKAAAPEALSADKSVIPAQSELTAACENLIAKFPFAMAVINAAPNIGKSFTYDDITAQSDMKNPVKLSNGLWLETDIPEEHIREAIGSITRFCENANKV